MNTETFEPATEPIPPADEQPVHLARCAECGFSLRYRKAGRTGYTVVDTTDRLFGIGEHNRPTCPEGHGEMEIADDRLPIEQAMEQAAEQINATTQRLPFPVPPFNYVGVLQSLCTKRHEIAQLEKRVDGCKEKLKNAKDDLDEANLELGKMIDQYEQDEQDRLHEIARREAAAVAGHPEDTTLVRCAWELAHPDDICPICGDPELQAQSARDSSAHLDEVAELANLRDIVAVVDALEDARIVVTPETVRGWSAEDRAVVLAWAGAPDASPRPAILGTAHVAGGSTTSEAEPGDTFQCCADCGARLLSYPTGTGGPVESYPAGTLVGSDCPGEPARYPKRGKKKAKP